MPTTGCVTSYTSAAAPKATGKLVARAEYRTGFVAFHFLEAADASHLLRLRMEWVQQYSRDATRCRVSRGERRRLSPSESLSCWHAEVALMTMTTQEVEIAALLLPVAEATLLKNSAKSENPPAAAAPHHLK